MEEKKEFTEQEKKDIINDLIMQGYSTFSVERFSKTWTFRTLSDTTKMECYDLASAEDDQNIQWKTYMLYIIKKALVAINNINLTEDIVNNICDKLPEPIVMSLFEEYQKLDDLSRDSINNVSVIKNMIKEDNYARIKFTVMKAFGALPTEQRVKDMNEQQWFWCYYNLFEDEREGFEKDKHKMDYLAYFINPELAAAVIKEEGKNTNNQTNVNQARDVVNPHNPNEVIHYGEGVTDVDFEAKLQHAMGNTTNVVELPEDTIKGNKYENENDFIKRAQMMEQQLQQMQEQVKQDAKKANVSEEEFDLIMFEEEE